jgi:hypothetical protein
MAVEGQLYFFTLLPCTSRSPKRGEISSRFFEISHGNKITTLDWGAGAGTSKNPLNWQIARTCVSYDVSFSDSQACIFFSNITNNLEEFISDFIEIVMPYGLTIYRVISLNKNPMNGMYDSRDYGLK